MKVILISVKLEIGATAGYRGLAAPRIAVKVPKVAIKNGGMRAFFGNEACPLIKPTKATHHNRAPRNRRN